MHRYSANVLRQQPEGKKRGKHGAVCLRAQVGVMVTNLESVISDLKNVMGDLKVLVHQIESVSTRIDQKYTSAESDNDCDICYERTRQRDLTNINRSVWQWKQANCNCTEITGPRDYQHSPIPSVAHDYSILIGDMKPFSYLDKGRFMLDKNCNIQPKPRGLNNALSRSDEFTYDSDGFMDDAWIPKEHIDTDSLASRYESELNIKELPIDRTRYDDMDSVFTSPERDIVNTFVSMPKVDPMHVHCREVIGHDSGLNYCGIYESVMEATLETGLNVVERSDCYSEGEGEDIDDDIIDIQSNLSESTNSFEYELDYDREVNPWTAYTMLHMDSVHLSDDNISESASDIVNKNILDNQQMHSENSSTCQQMKKCNESNSVINQQHSLLVFCT